MTEFTVKTEYLHIVTFLMFLKFWSSRWTLWSGEFWRCCDLIWARQSLIRLLRADVSEHSWGVVHQACVHDRSDSSLKRARLSGGGNRHHLKLHLKAALGLSRFPDYQHLVLQEPDKGFVRKVCPLQVSQSWAVHWQFSPLALVLDGEKHFRTVGGAVGVDSQLLAGNSRVHQTIRTGLGIPTQPEKVVSRVRSPASQRKEIIETFTVLLRMVELDAEASQKILLRLQCLRHTHGGRNWLKSERKTYYQKCFLKSKVSLDSRG